MIPKFYLTHPTVGARQLCEKPIMPGSKNRIAGLDLAKGFTVLFMPAVHSVMLYSEPAVYDSLFGRCLAWIAEWPGAQVFIIVMGISFSLSGRSTISQLRRAFIVFAGGYGLNVCKFVLLHELDLLPVSLIRDLDFSHDQSSSLNLFLIGDILQFAGIALAIMSVIKRLPDYELMAAFACCAIILISTYCWDLHHGNIIIDQILHLAGGSTDDVFFPLFPWLVYPMCGMVMGFQMQNRKGLLFLFIAGVILLVIGFGSHFLLILFPETSFWRTYPDGTLKHLGFALLWLYMWLKVGRLFEKNNTNSHFKRTFSYPLLMLQYCGRHISMIYVVQWLVICWALPFIGYQILPLKESVISVVIINAVVFALVDLMVWSKKINL